MADWSQEELEMTIRGPLTHIDLSVSDPDRSIPFYEALFEALGYKRLRIDAADSQGSKRRSPKRQRPAFGGKAVGASPRPGALK